MSYQIKQNMYYCCFQIYCCYNVSARLYVSLKVHKKYLKFLKKCFANLYVVINTSDKLFILLFVNLWVKVILIKCLQIVCLNFRYFLHFYLKTFFHKFAILELQKLPLINRLLYIKTFWKFY